ncbi:hypothetical protein [Sandarakinorhabdus sp. DWP1-3-1]|uniref:hypothetical protein n=1 Tax=Sandarakinorhabdus sp. DWP1-3-1 TaxID=2804627 RepID=UPI003CF91DF9
MNYLQLPPEDRPDLPTRDRGGDVIEVQCPVCGCWRPGFMLEPDGDDGWNCDAERSIAQRASDAAARPPEPAPPLPLLAFLRLWTAEETAAVYQSTNVYMIQARTLTLAAPSIDLALPEVIAGIDLAEQLGILTAPRAAAIKAGQPPA